MEIQCPVCQTVYKKSEERQIRQALKTKLFESVTNRQQAETVVSPPPTDFIGLGQRAPTRHRFWQAVAVFLVTILAAACITYRDAFGALAWAAVLGGLLSWLTFIVSLIGMDQVVLWAERLTQYDIDGDDMIAGEPVEVERPFPYKVGEKIRDGLKKTTDRPGLIRLHPSRRKIKRAQLWDFLLVSFGSSTDSRDGWSRRAWKGRGMSPRLHRDIQNFILYLDDNVWKTADSPTLYDALERFGWSGDRPDRDRTGPEATSVG